MVKETTHLDLGPCDTFAYGGVKDFMLAVDRQPLPPHTTLAPGVYCTGGPTSAQDSNLGAVRLVGDTQILEDTHDCPGALGVNDLTGKVRVPSTTLWKCVYYVE